MSTKMERYKEACAIIEGIVMHHEMNHDEIVSKFIYELWALVEKDNYKFHPLPDGDA